MKKKLKGSLTVEAALILSLYLWIIALSIQGATKLYASSRETAEAAMAETSWDAVGAFYRMENMGELEWKFNISGN